jgi:HSP20 family protein
MPLEISERRRPSWMTPVGSEGQGDVFFDRLAAEWSMGTEEEPWDPKVDFYEKDGKYYLEMELPGVPKKSLSVKVNMGRLNISGDKTCDGEPGGSAYYIKECRHGPFSRSLSLPADVEEEKIKATYRDGVLTVEMPLIPEAEVKQVQITEE